LADTQPWRIYKSISASLTALAAGSRMLSAAPQNHQVPGCAGSGSGLARRMDFSPAALTLLGPGAASGVKAKPPWVHASVMRSRLAGGSSSMHAVNVEP